MKLRGIEFGNPFVGSGTLNFFGEGWPYHKYLKLLPGFNFSGATLITKTTTLPARMPKSHEKGQGIGNLVLDPKTLQPVEFMPDCIKTNFLTGEVLNSVGLVGPGAKNLFERGLWQKIEKPFVLSFMAVSATEEGQLDETMRFTKVFQKHLPDFRVSVALEINDSCPNTKHRSNGTEEPLINRLKVTSPLGIPQGIKINVLASVNVMDRVARSGYCDFIDIPNTLPFGKCPSQVDWEGMYDAAGSPLAKYGGGGYSGRENFEMAAGWVKEFRKINSDAKIILGGVFSERDILLAEDVGANAVSFARLAMTRPLRVKNIIKAAQQIIWRE